MHTVSKAHMIILEGSHGTHFTNVKAKLGLGELPKVMQNLNTDMLVSNT